MGPGMGPGRGLNTDHRPRPETDRGLIFKYRLLPVGVYQLYGETLEENGIDLAEMKVLRRKIEELGIDSNLCKPGQYNHLICPMCICGDSGEKGLSLFITANGD
ncbi:hypothetical protein HYC85_018938 [Camellia sinensis]|uniref:Uncharacterized protein n=1 Tax=Camellia sinensis TaxID=4442 RepID=A0A7J7GY04_CAMSI|nr:hypothetical protein HYC85_018938 [Camellia sinensis]